MNGGLTVFERERQRGAIRQAFDRLGYEAACMRSDWRFGVPANGQPAHLGTLDLAIFHDPREYDYRTIAAAVELGQDALIQNKAQGRARAKELFAHTAAPHVMLGGAATTDIWLDCHNDPFPIKDIPMRPEALATALEEHRRKLGREALQRLRGGQTSLFDRFYEARREELAQALNRGFSEALANDPVWESDSRMAQLSAAAIAVLAARILEDKGFLAPNGHLPPPHVDALQLLRAVEAKADGFFTKVLSDLAAAGVKLGAARVNMALQHLFAHLTGPICFSLVTPEMLGHLYEGALIPKRSTRKRQAAADAKQQNRPKAQWIHYTPLTLTRHILRRLPVEEIRQDQRRLLDMACGSGTFLLAATERLANLYDARENSVESSLVAHLRARVIGYDIDEVALLVTKLTYLVAHWTAACSQDDIPNPTCKPRDALSLAAADFGNERPTVIVGNPPFESGKTQLANQFLGKAIDLLEPGGLLGMILPLGFLKMTREGCPEMRRQLLESCDLLEVWEQPLGAVGLHARQETCVLLARRRGARSRPMAATLFKQTHSSTSGTVRALKEHLRSTRTFAASGLPGRPSESWATDEKARIIASPLEAIWQKTDTERCIGVLCEGFKGIDMTGASSESFSTKPAEGMFPYMRQQALLRPYCITRADWHYYVNPTDGNRSRADSWPVLKREKVIVTMRGNRNKRRQCVAAYDPTFDGIGVFPEHDFSCFGIREDHANLAAWARNLVKSHNSQAILRWLAAVLNSPLAQAWVATRGAARGLSNDDITSVPLPRFDPVVPKLVEQVGKLPNSGRTLEKSACWEIFTTNPPGSNATFDAIAGHINHRIATAYGLSQEDIAALKSYLREMTEQETGTSDDTHLPRPGSQYYRIHGTVLGVDVIRQEMTLDIPRYRAGPLVVPLPRHIPGWALTNGVDFACEVPAESVCAADLRDPWLLREFMPVPYSYLSIDELEDLIGYPRSGGSVDEQ